MFKVLLMLIAGIFLSIDAFAQQITVKGIVKDTTGEPVIGANVVVKGTTTGTITDFDGNFQLSAKQGDIIVVSFIGYQPQELPVAAQMWARAPEYYHYANEGAYTIAGLEGYQLHTIEDGTAFHATHCFDEANVHKKTLVIRPAFFGKGDKIRRCGAAGRVPRTIAGHPSCGWRNWK